MQPPRASVLTPALPVRVPRSKRVKVGTTWPRALADDMLPCALAEVVGFDAADRRALAACTYALHKHRAAGADAAAAWLLSAGVDGALREYTEKRRELERRRARVRRRNDEEDGAEDESISGEINAYFGQLRSMSGNSLAHTLAGVAAALVALLLAGAASIPHVFYHRTASYSVGLFTHCLSNDACAVYGAREWSTLSSAPWSAVVATRINAICGIVAACGCAVAALIASQLGPATRRDSEAEVERSGDTEMAEIGRASGGAVAAAIAEATPAPRRPWNAAACLRRAVAVGAAAAIAATLAASIAVLALLPTLREGLETYCRRDRADAVCTFKAGVSYWLIVLALALSLIALALSLYAAVQATACNVRCATLVAAIGC